MNDYEKRSHSRFKEINKIRSTKDYIARKKAKSANQNFRGTKKDKKDDFIPGGKFYCN